MNDQVVLANFMTFSSAGFSMFKALVIMVGKGRYVVGEFLAR